LSSVNVKAYDSWNKPDTFSVDGAD